MFRLALTILAGLSLMNAPVKNTNIQNTNENVEIEEQIEYEEKVYNYEDEDGTIVVTLKSEDSYEAVLTHNDAVATISGKYLLKDEKLTLYLGEEILLEFVIKEDNKLEKFIVEEIPENDEDEIENNPYSGMSLNELIDCLRAELKKDSIDINTVSKILLAMLGLFATSIIGLLIAIIRMKIKNMKKDEIIAAVQDEANKKFAEYQNDVKGLINDLLYKVEKKIDDTEEQRKKEADAQNLKLKASIEKAKKNLAINDVLDKE